MNLRNWPGASVYPVDFNREQNSQHHPWLCSLRTRGFRGRHRCGVTLLSGPTVDSPADPFVLVGAAHCNYIGKDRVSGDVLETCCCRPAENPSTCNKVQGSFFMFSRITTSEKLTIMFLAFIWLGFYLETIGVLDHDLKACI